jgi:hypothetical protein
LDTIRPYWDMILLQRDWSWTLVALVYILAGILIRSWFIGPVFDKAKCLDKDLYHQIKKTYFQKSFVGWLAFYLPLTMVVALWRKDIFPIKVKDIFLIIPAIIFFVLSIILHLQAFGKACIETVRGQSDREKEKKLLEV